MDLQCQAGRIGELLEFHFPEPNPRTIGAAAIRCNHQTVCVWVTGLSHCFMPAADGVDCEFGCVVVDAEADPASVSCEIVDSIRNRPAKVLRRHAEKNESLL